MQEVRCSRLLSRKVSLTNKLTYEVLSIKILGPSPVRIGGIRFVRKSENVMNYDGAEGLEFGRGNTAIDPAVAAGQFS